MSITSKIKPFVTNLPLLQSASPIVKTPDGLIKMSIVDYMATLYKDTSTTPDTTITADVWTYKRTITPKSSARSWLGPLIQVQNGIPLQFEWQNEIADPSPFPNPGSYPVAEVQETTPSADGSSPPQIPQNVLGANAPIKPDKGYPFFSTHLHGANTAPNYDGWPESMMRPGQSRRVRYDNTERATMLWYHDHAIYSTRLNVFAGMAGAYVIRDAVEDALQTNYNLPSGGDELARVLRDCNLTLDATAPLSPGDNHTNLLHKTENGVIEFFGPINMVNGAIWPRKSVDPGLYRVQILNGASARTYALRFVTGNAVSGPWTPAVGLPIHQIGSDGGRMSSPRDLTDQAIVLMPAERIDLLIDFSDFVGQKIMMVNAVAAPFGGDGSLLDLASPPPSNPDNDREDPTLPYDPDSDPPNEPYRNPYPQVMRFDVKSSATPNHPNNSDMLSILGALPTLVMQPNPDPSEVGAQSVRKGKDVVISLGSAAPPTETGLKDTIRVDPMTMVEVVARFEGYLGRYLYHCHLLEHEDHDMMRQFVVTRQDLHNVMPHNSMHVPGSLGK